MKLKKLLSFALALCMVLAFIPALSLTASATTYDSGTLVNAAKCTFAPENIDTTSTSNWWCDIYFGGELAEASDWAGWSSDNTALRLYTIGYTGDTFIAIDSHGTDGAIYTLTASDAVQKATAGMDYIIVEWTGNDAQSYSAGAGSYFDVAYADSDGIFDAFRYTKGSTAGINHQYAYASIGWPYTSFADEDVDLTYDYVDNEDAADGATADYTLYRMVYANDESGDGYTASYYYNDNGTSGNYVLIGTKTFATGSVDCFKEMQFGYLSADARIDYFKIYAGEYPSDEDPKYTVTVNYTYNGETIATATSEAALSGATAAFDEKTVTAEDGTVYYWKSASYTVGSENTTETLEAFSVNGIIASYDFADGANDAVGSYDATNQGVEFKNGIATFDGGTGTNTDVIQLPDSIMKALDSNFSISMWVKQDSTYSNDSGSITFFEFSSGSYYNRLFWQQAGTAVTLQERGGSTNSRVYQTGTTDAMKDEWALITVSFDFENGVATAYIDGEEFTMSVGTGTWSTANTPANIYKVSSDTSKVFPNFGQNVWASDSSQAANPAFKGEMAAIKIYDSALTATEAATANMDAHKTVTVSYVDSEGNAIADDEVVDYFLDEAEIDLPETIVYNKVSYTLSGDSTVTTSDTTYAATYTAGDAVYDATVTVTAGGEDAYTVSATNLTGASTVSLEERTFLFNGKIYSVAAQDVPVSAGNANPEVKADVEQEYAMTSVYTSSGDETSQGGYIGAAGHSSITQNDDDGVALATNSQGFLSARKVTMTFELPELLDGQAALLHVAAGGIKANDSRTGVIRLRATGNSTSAYTTSLSDSKNGQTFSAPEYMTADITDLINAAAADDTTLSIEFESALGAIYFVGVSNASIGGGVEGQASYIEIVDAATVTLPSSDYYITYNGAKRTATNNEVTVVPGGTIIVYDANGNTVDAYAVDADGNATQYAAGSTIAIDGDTTIFTDLGVSLVKGAQIRIGSNGLTDDKITTDSGIRFIAIVDRGDTLAGVADTDENGIEKIGIAIWDGGFDTAEFDAESWTADESTRAYQIPAKLYQDPAKMIFTAAITDIDEANFNRIYIAAPYVTVNGTTYYGTPVARTPYQVAAGILTSNTDDASTYDYSVETDAQKAALYAVLNAYANQTGARLILSQTTEGYSVVEATYENNAAEKVGYANGAPAFFTAAISEDNGTYTITLTAVGSETKFYGYAESSYRVNGASASAFAGSELFEDGSVNVAFNDDYTEMTITFTPAASE